MGKRGGGLASIFSKPKLAAADSPSRSWPAWPSCANHPQTASFRDGDDDHQPCTTSAAARLRPPSMAAAGDDMYRTVNSVYFDSTRSSCLFEEDDEGDGDAEDAVVDMDDGSFSTTTASEEWSEAVIRSLGRAPTDRFFFDPPGPPPVSNSILAASRSPSPGRRTLVTVPPEAKAQAAVAAISDDPDSDSDEEQLSTSLVEESVAVALDTEDPYGDFRASMAEMVAAHGLRDWAALQEMLLWYLRINGKHNHALIVGAFVDLLVGLATSTSPSAATGTTTTTTATVTTTTTFSNSSSSSTSSSGGDGVTPTSASVAASAMEEQSGGGTTDASCSFASSDQEEGEEEPVVEEKLGK